MVGVTEPGWEEGARPEHMKLQRRRREGGTGRRMEMRPGSGGSGDAPAVGIVRKDEREQPSPDQETALLIREERGQIGRAHV